MIIDVVMPKMGESLQEGTILKWLKKEGEHIERDEMILEISTDKVDTEVPAPAAGILFKIYAQENETIEVGKKIAEIETEGTAVLQPEQTLKSQSLKVEEPKVSTEQKPEPKVEMSIETPVTAKVNDGKLIDVVMPKMGESLQEGTILKWLKKAGDVIERDEMILEISTDKVDTEVPSPVAGILVEILVQEGQTVEVGSVIARINSGGEASSYQTTEVKQSVQPSETASTKPVPQNISVIPEEIITEIPRVDGEKFYSPLVRSIAETEGVSLNELRLIQGTGIEGRVSKQDILNFIENKKNAKTQPPPVQQPISPPKTAPVQKATVSTVPSVQPPQPVVYGSDTEIIPMDRIRQLISEHMSYSKHTSAHVTSVAEADVTGLVKYREKYKDGFEKREGFKLTYMPFFVKAVIDGVRAFPRINVSVDGKNIIQHRRTHLGFATALPDGNLIVPVIKNADALSLSGLSRSVDDLSTRARSKKLNPDDIQGGTITLTNVGTFGTLFGTPVINQPQCAIIGVGAIKKRAVVRDFNGEDIIVVRNMMYVSITYDHRVIDGQLAGQALAAIVKSIEGMNEATISL